MRAISRELATLKQAEIDPALAEMASAPEYQADVLQIETEFVTAYLIGKPLNWRSLKNKKQYQSKRYPGTLTHPLPLSPFNLKNILNTFPRRFLLPPHRHQKTLSRLSFHHIHPPFSRLQRISIATQRRSLLQSR